MNDDQAVYVDETKFLITGGTKVFGKLETALDGQGVKWIGTFPSLFDDQDLAVSDTWSPWQPIFSGESILDLSLLHDQLSKRLGGATFDKPVSVTDPK